MIYYLDTDPAKCAAMLDDRSLNKQIKAVAQVLCDCHYVFCSKPTFKPGNHICNVPLKPSAETIAEMDRKFTKWASQCVANYKRLVGMGVACCEEYTFRFSERGQDNKWKDAGWIDFSIPYYKELKEHKLKSVIEWCKQNVPYLPQWTCEDISCCTKACGHDKATPFPLVMPHLHKYIAGVPIYNEKGKFSKTEIDVIESYRNYYRAKLHKTKKIKCELCKGTGIAGIGMSADMPCLKCDDGYITEPINPTWTRREPPSFLQFHWDNNIP